MPYRVIASGRRLFVTHLGQICLAIALLSALAVGGALTIEHIGGVAPCPLCLDQRIAYYAAVPVALLAFALLPGNVPLCRALLALLAVGFLVNTGLGIYHSGIEWGWWAGPETCSGAGSIARTPAALLEDLKNPRVVRCDAAALRILGLSLAGYSALTSAWLAALAGLGAAAGRSLSR
jgi:disulfide bond formation protein DsbB